LFVIACLFAGCFGAFHNQISYTVSPEYFTQFKFHQFNIGEAVPHRIGAARVGWQASWWMGLVIGVVLIPAGLAIKGTWEYFWGMIRVFAVVTVTTLAVGLLALAFASFTISSESTAQAVRYGNEIANDAAFNRAGTMHNFSYLGGLLGIITGALSIYWTCCRQTDERIRIGKSRRKRKKVHKNFCSSKVNHKQR
jgi:hypothetical protein